MYKSRLFNHFKDFNAACDGVGVPGLSAQLDCRSFRLKVVSEHSECLFYPQFLESLEHRFHYSNAFSESAKIFSGWRPYLPRSLRLFSDKVLFKSWLVKHAFQTPNYGLNLSLATRDFIIKKMASGFSDGMRGPFKSHVGGLALNSGEYFEDFILGDILKIWFWNDQLVCMEKQPMPFVKGDGKRNIGEMVAEQAGRLWMQNHGWEETISQVLAYQDVSYDDVLAYGQIQMVDIRYGSAGGNPFNVIDCVNVDSMLSEQYPMLSKLGVELFSCIRCQYDELAYTVDAILDVKGQLWILEANANPAIHPQLYTEMLHTLMVEKEVAQSSLMV